MPDTPQRAESVVVNHHVHEAIQNALRQARRDLQATKEAEIPPQAKWRRETQPSIIAHFEEKIAALEAVLIDGDRWR